MTEDDAMQTETQTFEPLSHADVQAILRQAERQRALVIAGFFRRLFGRSDAAAAAPAAGAAHA
ncbi:hypothetical protein [Pseudooceanicola nanhaiensis]|uniref:hypothetical protein n=1 Tax=Pseudooceanicola nanhaiensis TaxID=375761 RepID=UPI00405A2B64